MSRENYYVLLELDPEETDAARIEEAIRKKQADWSRERNHPTKGRQAQQNLGLLRDIRAVMTDHARREEEGREASRLLKDKQKEATRLLGKEISILEAAGYMTEAQVAKLAQRFKGRFAEEDIRRRIKVPIRKAAVPSAAPKPVLEKGTADFIRDRLDRFFKKRDLYDFLDRPPTSSLLALQARTRERDAEVRKFNTKTAEVTAQQELLGYCLRLFKDERERQKYDNTLDQQHLTELDPVIEAAGTDGKINAAVMEQLLRSASEKGVTLAEARMYILDFASKKKWSVEVPQATATVNLRRCGACGTLNDEKAAACRDCGQPLTVECPKCRTVNASDNRACTACGFSVGDAFLVRRLLRDADHAFAQGANRVAAMLLKEAQVYWHESTDIRSRLEAVGKREREETEAYNQVMAAVADHRFVEGKRLLGNLKRLSPDHPGAGTLERQIDTGLEAAKKHAGRGRTLEQSGKLDDAIDAYTDALRECKDLTDAIIGLAKCPPEAPLDLQASSTVRAIVLSWKPSPSRGVVSYHVVCKSGSEPRALSDGDRAVQTVTTSFTDSEAIAGELYYYGVFAERGGAHSLRPTLVGPVLRVAEVEALRVMAGDHCVTLAWSPPRGAGAVEVWRKEGSIPQRRGEGTRLASVTSSSASDTNLTNGDCYGYRVVTVFRGADGKPVYSDGATATAVPTEFPQPVTDLAVVRRGGDFEATWTPPAIGQVQVFGSGERTPYRCGDLISAEDLEKLGRRVPALGARSARGSIGTGELIHLVPVSISGSAVIVGQEVVLSCIDDIDELTVMVTDHTLLARWAWPPQIDTATVVFRRDQFPSGPDDGHATRYVCPRLKYDREGGFRTHAPKADRLYVVVYAMAKQGSEEHYASGASPGARMDVPIRRFRSIRYRVAPKFRLLGKGGQYVLTITPDADTALPELVLVAKSGGMPLHPTNGRTVLRIPAGSDCGPTRPLTVTFRPDGFPGRWKARLFPADDRDCQWLDLVEEV